MTLHEKIDYIIDNIGTPGSGGDTTPQNYLDIWLAGLCHGFTEYMYARDGSGTSISYNQYYCRMSHSRPRYTWTSGQYLINNKVDLTNINTIEMSSSLYNTWNSNTHGGVGLAVHKDVISTVNTSGGLPSEFTISAGIPIPISSINNIIQLDVSSLIGEYYVYVYIWTSNSGEINSSKNGCTVDIQYIHGLYI